MFDAMEVSAFARVDGKTSITFLTACEGMTEFCFDKDGLILTVDEGALHKLADVVSAAVVERRERNALEELEDED